MSVLLFLFLCGLLVILLGIMMSDSERSPSEEKVASLETQPSYAEAELLHLASETETLTTQTIQQRFFESKDIPKTPDYWGYDGDLSQETALKLDNPPKTATIPLLPSSNIPRFPQRPSYIQMFKDKLKQQEQHLLELTQKIHQEQQRKHALQLELEQLSINQQETELSNQKLENFVRKLEQEKSSLEQNLQQTRNQVKLGLIGFTVVIIALIFLWVDSNSKNRTIQRQISQLETKQESANNLNTSDSEAIKKLEQDNQRLTQKQEILYSILQLSGWQSQQISNLESDTKRAEILQANQEYQQLITNLKKAPPFPTIIYYPKTVEPQETVKKSLKSLGFPLAILTPKVTEIPTNYLLYSSDIPLEKVQLVAYNLIRSGVEIKYIGNLRLKPNQSYLIEIGADPKYNNNPTVTVEQIGSIPNLH
jgi:hypothetical protein